MARLGIDRAALEGFIARLGKTHPLNLAILFGSRARGDELRDSDYDILLVSEAFAGMPAWDRIATCLEQWDCDEPLEVVALTPAEFERRKDDLTVVGEAVRNGTVVLTSSAPCAGPPGSPSPSAPSRRSS